MRRLLVAGAGLIACGTAIPAKAADIRMPVKAVYAPAQFYNWSGFYVGAHVGYGWGRFSAPDPIDVGITNSAQSKGFLGGAQVGVNYQIGGWVLGVEGEYSWANLKLREEDGTGDFAELKIDQIATLAGRFGYAFDRTLFYGKIGGAWAHEKWDVLFLGDTAKASIDRTGWLLGAGVEYAFAPNWSAKLEYNYLALGRRTVTFATTGTLTADPAEVKLNVQTVKLGLNYRFNWGP